MPTPMTKQYDEAYFQHWYRRADIGGSARLAGTSSSAPREARRLINKLG